MQNGLQRARPNAGIARCYHVDQATTSRLNQAAQAGA